MRRPLAEQQRSRSGVEIFLAIRQTTFFCGIRALAPVFLLASLVLVTPGCSSESEASVAESAQASLDKNDVNTAIIRAKTGLQKAPNSGRLRYLLGTGLLAIQASGDAVVELTKARELRYDDNLVVPALTAALLASGQARKVSDQFAQTTLTDPGAAAALKSSLAAAYVAQGQLDAARAAVDAALQANPRNINARLMQARFAAGRGALDEALTLVGKLIGDEPNHAQAWLLQGELLWTGRADAAAGEAAFRKALALDSKDMRAHTTLLQLLLMQGKVEPFKAQIAVLQKSLPGSFEARFYAVQLALLQNDMKAAQAGVQELLKVSPDYAPVLQLAGTVELQVGALGLAQKHLSQAVQQAPTVSAARRLLAEALLRGGKAGEALATLKPLLDAPQPASEELGLAAQAHLQESNFARAEFFYALAAKSNASDAKAPVALALVQVAKGNAGSGLAQLETLASKEETTFADLALISERVRLNDLAGGLKAIDRLEQKTPQAALPAFLRGRLLALRKDESGARQNFELALQKDPVYFPAIVELGSMDVQQAKPADARKRFEAVLQREPDNFKARLALAELRQREGAKPDDVEKTLLDIVKASPQEPAPRLALVEHQLALRRDKAALQVAQEAVAAFPDHVQVADALGRAQLAAGESQQAMNTFLKIASRHAKVPEPYLRLAQVHAASKDYPAALQNLQRALDVSPKLLVAQRALVQIHLAQKRVAEAVLVAKQVQKERPTEAVGHVMEAEIQIAQRAWTPAVAALRDALARERTTEVATAVHGTLLMAGRSEDAARFAASWEAERPADIAFLFHLGLMATQARNYAAAEGRYRQVLAVKPANVASLNNLAAVMAKQNKAGALSYVEKANALLPEQAAVLDTMASVLAAEKQLGKAVEWQQKAVAREPETPAYRLALARLLIETGDRTQARTELQKLAALGGRFSEQPEVAALLKNL